MNFVAPFMVKSLNKNTFFATQYIAITRTHFNEWAWIVFFYKFILLE